MAGILAYFLGPEGFWGSVRIRWTRSLNCPQKFGRDLPAGFPDWTKPGALRGFPFGFGNPGNFGFHGEGSPWSCCPKPVTLFRGAPDLYPCFRTVSMYFARRSFAQRVAKCVNRLVKVFSSTIASGQTPVRSSSWRADCHFDGQGGQAFEMPFRE